MSLLCLLSAISVWAPSCYYETFRGRGLTLSIKEGVGLDVVVAQTRDPTVLHLSSADCIKIHFTLQGIASICLAVRISFALYGRAAAERALQWSTQAERLLQCWHLFSFTKTTNMLRAQTKKSLLITDVHSQLFSCRYIWQDLYSAKEYSTYSSVNIRCSSTVKVVQSKIPLKGAVQKLTHYLFTSMWVERAIDRIYGDSQQNSRSMGLVKRNPSLWNPRNWFEESLFTPSVHPLQRGWELTL